MAKYYGTIGFSITEETSPGIWEKVVSTRQYKGDVLKDYISNKPSEYLNDDILINNIVSIVADRFAMEHFQTIVYVEWLGVKWKVSSIEVDFPRLKLTLGGSYNGE